MVNKEKLILLQVTFEVCNYNDDNFKNSKDKATSLHNALCEGIHEDDCGSGREEAMKWLEDNVVDISFPERKDWPKPISLEEFRTQIGLGSLSDEKKIEIARNPNTLPEILTTLSSKDPNGDSHSWYVQSAVASNPNTPPETLTRMSDSQNPDWDEDVAQAVKENPSTPKEVVDEINRFFDEDF